MDGTVEDSTLDELTREECLKLVGALTVGRIAVAAPDSSPLVVPVNYLLDGEVVVFRTGPGTKLRELRGTPVSFQVDEFDQLRHTGWSVLVRGNAYEATHWETDHLVLPTWAPGKKGHWIRVVPAAITGRRIRLPDQFVDLGGYL